VYDASRVRGLEGLSNLERHLHRLLGSQRARGCDPIFEGAAGQVLHGYVVRPVLRLSPVKDGDDIRAAKDRCALGLAPEALDEFFVLGVAFLQQLEGHFPAEDLVTSQVDFRHASAADEAA
jgi:hypothetical protein